MRLIATLFVLVAGFATSVPGQCTVPTAASPRLVNIKLGMSPPEVNAALAGAARVSVKKDGHYSYFKSFRKPGRANGVLTGARAFYVRFFDRQAYQVEIFYHSGYKSAYLENFVRDYALEAGFAFENFEFKNGYATAECEGFTVEADTILNPHIEITDVALKKLVGESRK